MLQSKPQLKSISLIWDDFNTEHIKKHGVSQDEVVQVIKGNTLTLQGYNHRLLVLGSCENGRLLTIVLDNVWSDQAYVVTARPMSKKERLFFKQNQEKVDDKN